VIKSRERSFNVSVDYSRLKAPSQLSTFYKERYRPRVVFSRTPLCSKPTFPCEPKQQLRQFMLQTEQQRKDIKHTLNNVLYKQVVSAIKDNKIQESVGMID
jgi:hypothetical protein